MASVVVPTVRAYVRWAPWSMGKRALVEGLVEPRLPRREHTFRARTVHGARLTGDHRTIMPRCIYWFGVWEPLLTQWVRQRLRPGDVFVDVGANMGYFTVLAAQAVRPGGSVVAIEPEPTTFQKLSTNVALNGGADVRAVQGGAGVREERVAFYQAPWNDAENSTVPKPGVQAAGEIEVSPLARLLSDGEIARTRLIKVDVEGGEWDVVAGLVPDIARFAADMELVIEVHPQSDSSRTAGALADMLAPYGFAASWLPVDFDAVAHLDHRDTVQPAPGLPPSECLFHLILSRTSSVRRRRDPSRTPSRAPHPRR
jgi:FkbM family methyltransferase